jgi:hypothetical protein
MAHNCPRMRRWPCGDGSLWLAAFRPVYGLMQYRIKLPASLWAIRRVPPFVAARVFSLFLASGLLPSAAWPLPVPPRRIPVACSSPRLQRSVDPLNPLEE